MQADLVNQKWGLNTYLWRSWFRLHCSSHWRTQAGAQLPQSVWCQVSNFHSVHDLTAQTCMQFLEPLLAGFPHVAAHTKLKRC